MHYRFTNHALTRWRQRFVGRSDSELRERANVAWPIPQALWPYLPGSGFDGVDTHPVFDHELGALFVLSRDHRSIITVYRPIRGLLVLLRRTYAAEVSPGGCGQPPGGVSRDGQPTDPGTGVPRE